MRALVLRRAHIRLAAIAAVILVVSVMRGGDAPVVSSGNFSPTTSLTLSDHAPGANPDSTSSFNVASGQMLGAPVALTPQAATLSASPATIPTGLGDVVGTTTSSSAAGLNNGPCNFPIAVSITLLSATADNSAGNLIYPSNAWEAGPSGPLSPLRQDTYAVTPDNIAGNGNDVIGAAAAGSAPSSPANGLPAHVDRYPGFLNTVFDPDGGGPSPSITPLARYSGSTVVLATTIVVIQVVVFSPGALAAYDAPTTLSDLSDAALGYASVVVLNDPTAVPLPGGAVTDLCSPLSSSSTLYGITKTNPCAGNTLPPCQTDDGINSPVAGLATGRVRYANPASAGTYSWYGFHTSARDLDNDGIENSLDTCPYNVNVDGDPRTTSGPDSDMIDSVCDPTPAVDTGAGDHDGDGYKNAADNCPLVANPTQAQAEENEPANIASPRGGSTTDTIGDACDGPEVGTTFCTDLTDDDSDGFINDGCPANSTAESSCSDAVDDDFDSSVNDGCPTVGTSERAQCSGFDDNDSDGDGLVNDGCPTAGAATAETTCTFSTSTEVDNDNDGFPNDGCPQGGASPEGGADNNGNGVGDGCEDFANADSGEDALVNDGCPAQGGAELGCLNSWDDDSGSNDSAFNDGCPSSSRVANGHYHTVLTVMPKCIGGTDADGDGWCATGQTGVPSDPADGDASRTPETYSQFRPFMVAHSGSGSNPPLSREPLQACNDGVDNDGDTLVDLLDGTSAAAATTDDCRPPDVIFTAGPDTDGDGSRDTVEIHLGSDPLSRCHRGLDPNATTASKGWGRDVRGETNFHGDNVNVGDLATVFSHFGSPAQAAYNRRYDIRPGSTVGAWINVQDLAGLSSSVPVPMYGVSAWLFQSRCSANKVYGD